MDLDSDPGVVPELLADPQVDPQRVAQVYLLEDTRQLCQDC